MLTAPTLNLKFRPQDKAYSQAIFSNVFTLPERFSTSDRIVDIGARNGAFAVACLLRGAGEVECYEPDQEAFDLLKENTSWFLGAKCHQFFAWAGEKPEKLETIHLDDVLRKHTRLLKVDAFGVEYALADCSRLDNVEEIVGVCHPCRIKVGQFSECDIGTLSRFLASKGFSVLCEERGNDHIFWGTR